ncbi:RNA polymerase III subunit C82 [Saxophila tyrrhenica]|uniref:DNA-directed RNA polymerase III subunit RPC3 n=1 Tax=Saxophila tyrrhenica TaxID=1690608 RepID=A0AAV9PJB1_9PEZI|nr:RNA polymerase III subunit C82 [Saxophila tyrrhenica]
MSKASGDQQSTLRHLKELCLILVDKAFGQIGAANKIKQIFSYLADHGRQPLAVIKQYTRIPLRRLKLALGILIQHHLIRHYCQSEEYGYPTQFQVDWKSAYSIVRAPKFLKLVKDREGEVAGDVLAKVLHAGHATVDHLADEYVPERIAKAKQLKKQAAKEKAAKDKAAKRDSGISNGKPNGDQAGASKEGVNGKPKLKLKTTTADDESMDKSEDEEEVDGSQNGLDDNEDDSDESPNGDDEDGVANDQSPKGNGEDKEDAGPSLREELNFGKAGDDAEYDDFDYESDDESRLTMSEPELHILLRKLLKEGYLNKVGPRSFIPEADLDEEIKETIIKERFPDGRITGPKTGPQYQEAFNSLKRKYEEEDAYNEVTDASHGEIKRPRLNGSLTNGDHSEASSTAANDPPFMKLSEDLVVGVNYDKSALMLRSIKLEALAERSVGSETGAVYGIILRQLENSVKFKKELDKVKKEEFEDEGQNGGEGQNAGERENQNEGENDGEGENEGANEGANEGEGENIVGVNGDDDDDDDEEPLPSITDGAVLEHLDELTDLESTLKRGGPLSPEIKMEGNDGDAPQAASNGEPATNGQQASDVPIKAEPDADPDADNEGAAEDPFMASLKARNRRLTHLEEHLEVLAEQPGDFLSHSSTTHESFLNITQLTKNVIASELDSAIKARFGKNAHRIVRLLREKGKLTDLQVAVTGLVDINDVRTILTNLQFKGFLDISELPKDNTRQPAKTLYLYSWLPKQARRLVMESTYKTMSRLLQRIEVERKGKYKNIIEKGERAKTWEVQTLSDQEKTLLKEWNDVEEKMMVQVQRCDDLVAVLRDFAGDGPELKY